jgi:ADP-ribose pyrophosphatase YjhB (NUDIX family)
MEQHPRNPYVAVDAIIRVKGGAKIICIKRKNPPYGLALPGGFVNYGESAEDAIKREVMEEVGVRLDLLAQFHTYSAPDRDPRHHTLSVVFIAWSEDEPKAGDDAAEVLLVNTLDIPKLEFAFDHAKILEDWRGLGQYRH